MSNENEPLQAFLPATEPPAEPTAEPATLEELIDMRQKILANEHPTMEDLRRAHAAIRRSRIAAGAYTAPRGKKAKGKVKSAPMSDGDLDAMMANLGGE